MSDQQPPPPPATTPRQSRRGRRRPNNQEEGNQEETSLLASSPKSVNSTSSRKWTRSLSPRRLAGRGNDITDTDTTNDATMAQMNASFGSSLVASIKRLTGRGARSQSPRPRKELMGPLESPAVARISEEDDDKKVRRKSPKRSRSNPRSRSSTSSIGLNEVPPSLTRSKSDSVPRSRVRHRSTSPRKASSDELLVDRKNDADHDSRSGRNAPLRPPSRRDLRLVMEQQQKMHQSAKSNDNFMLLESDESEITTDNLNFSPTDTIKMAARADNKPQDKEKKLSRKPSSQSSSRSSSRSSQQRRPRSARHMKSLNDIDDAMEKHKNKMDNRPVPSSTRSLEMLTQKPSSDPGKGSRSGTPSRRPPSFRNSRSGGKKPSSSSSAGNKLPSEKNLTTLSSHEKPSSDPGRYRGGPSSTKPPRSSSSSSNKSTSLSNHALNAENIAKTGDKTPRPVIERPNLGKELLQHVADVKESIRRMRTQQYAQRHKVQFTGNKGTPTSPGQVPKSKSAPPSTPAAAAAIASNLQDSQSSINRQGGSGSSLSYTDTQNNSSFVRLQPGITMSDLEVGFLKSPTIAKQGQCSSNNMSQSQELQPPLIDAEQRHKEKVDSLVKSIKKTKKLIKRTCRDVWAERDEVVHMQRTNWSIRKALLQTDVPKDSITSLNLKIESALRQEREVTTELEELLDEKQQVDLECSSLAKSIEEFRDLLDALNTQVVPLFPAEGEPNDEYNYEQEGTTATAAVVQLMDDNDFDDSIHSTDVL